MGLLERQAVDRAFRAGLLESDGAAPSGLCEDGDIGAGELRILATSRLPGLADTNAAYETGRVLRHVARLFDKARAPVIIAEQFRDNLAAAIMTHHMRRTRREWLVDDTISMFLEMYERVLQPTSDDLQSVQAYMQERAKKPVRQPPSSHWGESKLHAA